MTNHLDRSLYEIRPVDQATARGLVEAHHYARGGPNTGVHRHGLFLRGDDRCLGVAWWLPPTRVAAESVSADWRSVLSLSRLVVVPEVPTNGASFLIGQSVRALRREGRWKTLLTYADEGQGHTGAIYRATNWIFVGTRPGDPVYVDPASGRMVARKSAGTSRTNQQMLDLGYVNTGRTRKHKFVMHLA